MDVFRAGNSGRAVRMFGPLATTNVRISGFGPANDENWALVSLDLNFQEIVDIRKCFDDCAYLFALGDDLSKAAFTMHFLVFLSRPGCNAGGEFEALKKGLAAYNRERVSVVKAATNISVGAMTGQGWLRGVSVGGFDADRGVCSVSLTYIARLNG